MTKGRQVCYLVGVGSLQGLAKVVWAEAGRPRSQSTPESTALEKLRHAAGPSGPKSSEGCCGQGHRKARAKSPCRASVVTEVGAHRRRPATVASLARPRGGFGMRVGLSPPREAKGPPARLLAASCHACCVSRPPRQPSQSSAHAARAACGT